jgi:acetyl-CoA carboxylase carboxyltransferase component
MPTMRELVAELEARKARARAMGGGERIARQHERGKWTARERLAAFYDDGAFVELGLHGAPDDSTPADAVITAWGKSGGRHVCVCAYDFTVKGGSIGMVGETKVARLRELSLRCRAPMVWFIDSGGARIEPGGAGAALISQFAGTGALFREQVHMSGVVPQVAAMVGPGAAGTAYIPALADFVPMLKGIGSMALGGPALVKAVTGQDISEQELGGSRVHTEASGVGDIEVEGEAACIALIKEYLGYFPAHAGELPPILPVSDPIERRDEGLLDVLPERARASYDMAEIVKRIVDDGRCLELKPRWARMILTGLARLGGRPVGIVANNPRHTGGVLTSDAADKAARFIQICDAFSIPLVFLMDVPGFMVGSAVEHGGIIRHGAKMLHAMAIASVAKLTCVVRKGYGAGYYVMAGRAYEPNLLVAWPGAEISVMGAEGMVSIAGKKMFGGAEPPPEIKAQLSARLQQDIDIYKVAGHGLVDDVIDPRDTRRMLCQAVELSWGRRAPRHERHRSIMPV